MREEFIPYKLAVKLKAVGFDEPCMYAWCITPKHLGEREGDLFLRTDGNPFGDFFTGKNWNVSYNNNKNKIKCSAPTFSQAFRWYREKYQKNNILFSDGYQWTFDLRWADEDSLDKYPSVQFPRREVGREMFDTYEEAELACLKKLIEIVELKSQQ